MLTVWSVCVGDKYDSSYVYRLKEMVERHLSIEHQFICITPRKLDGIQTRNPPVPYHGWWSKLGLFYPRVTTGPNLFFDLDVVIVGSLDYLVEYTDTFSAPANWAQSGHGGIQSSVMAWPGGWTLPYDKVKNQWPQVASRLWGDQEFLWEILKDDWKRIPGICSYKYHCRKGLPENVSTVVFHGNPKPHEVQDPWILPYIPTLDSTIRSNTPTTLLKASVS